MGDPCGKRRNISIKTFVKQNALQFFKNKIFM
jgi:hypothetical protein